jgi:hypothetical protein
MFYVYNSIKKTVIYLFFYPLLVLGQTQIGNTIYGDKGSISTLFGSHVSISDNGNIIAVSARAKDSNGLNAGQVRVYTNTNSNWVQIGNDINGEAANDLFGESLSLSGDGTILAASSKNNDDNGSNSGHVRIYKLIEGLWVQIGDTIKGKSTGDASGDSISLSSDGNTIAIGASRNDDNGLNSGHVRVYRNVNDSWIQIGNDINGDANGDAFGESISLSNDGLILAVGALKNDDNGLNSGHVSVYKNINDSWVQIGNNIVGESEYDEFGESISVSSDGSIIAIGTSKNSENSGRVRIYKNINDSWTQIGGNINGEAILDFSGRSISLSSDGSIVAIGAPQNDNSNLNSGHVRIYRNVNDSWIQIGNDIDGEAKYDAFGESVSISGDGSILVIGAPRNSETGGGSGHARIYENVNDSWVQIGNDIDGEFGVSADNFGESIDISSDGSVIAVGVPGNDAYKGDVRVFKNTNSKWDQIGDNIEGEADGDRFGTSVCLSSDGSIVAIGSKFNDGNGFNSGHVRIYKNINDSWVQIGNDLDGEFAFDESGNSISLSLDGSTVAIGSYKNNKNGTNSGHVRIYKNMNDSWVQIGNDINGQAEDAGLGYSVSLSFDGKILAVGIPYNHDFSFGSSSVKVYENVNDSWVQMGNDISKDAPYNIFGFSVNLSADGSVLAVGSRYNNSSELSILSNVSVYRNNNNSWEQFGTEIINTDVNDSETRKGGISLSSDGNILAVGTRYYNNPSSGQIKIYKNINDNWTQIGNTVLENSSNDYLEDSVSLSFDGSKIAIGAYGDDSFGIDSGYARVYDLSAVLSTKSFEKDYFSFYPNPVKDELNINLKKGLELKQVNIYNLQSQYLYSVKTSKIDVSNISTGVYFVEVVTNEGKSTKKIVID